jgi:hypothetical protein
MGNVFNIARAHDVDVNRDIIMNEAVYFGKTKEVLKIESLFGDLQKTFKDGKTKDIIKKIRALENYTEEFINAESVCVDIGSSSMTLKSYVRITDAYYFDYFEKRTKTDKDGLRFKNSKNKILAIAIGEDLLKEATPGQLTAVYLHEIGHSMYMPIPEQIIMAPSALVVFSIMEISVRVAELINRVETFKKLNEYIMKIPRVFMISINKIMSRIFRVLEPVMAVIKIKMIPSSFLSAIVGYDGEVYSDSFATAYGYGKELTEALILIDKIYNHIDTKNDFFKNWLYSADALSAFFQQFSHPHMTNINRAYSNIRYLEQAKKDTMNPKIKQMIQEDIDELNNLMKAIEKDKDGDMFDKYLIGMSQATGIPAIDFRHVLSFIKNGKNTNLEDFS